MIYVTAPGKAKGSWGLTSRLFLLALKGTGIPIRLVWRDKVVIQEGDFEPELESIRDMASAPPLGPPVEPCHAVIRIGEVMDVLADVQAERALYEIALVDWPTDTVPPRVARRLQRLDEVWCWSIEGTCKLKEAGVEARYVPIPIDTAALQAASPLTKKTDEHLYYTCGTWEGWDDTSKAAEAFCRAFSPKDTVRLILACDDAPEELREVLAKRSERPSKALPKVSLVKNAGSTLATLRRLHAAGQTYIETSRRVGAGVQALFAAASESLYVAERAPEIIKDADAYGLWRAPQKVWETDVTALARRLRAGWDQESPLYMGWDSAVHALKTALEAVPTPEDLGDPVSVKGSSRPPDPPLCIIIPHRDSPTDWVEDVVARIRPQIRPFDELIVSTQTDDEVVLLELEGLANKHSFDLVVDEAPGAVWNIARARNGGLWASQTGDYVLTLDCDIAVPEDYLSLVRSYLVDHPDKGIVPDVLQLELYTKGTDELPKTAEPKRHGTGLSVLPKNLVIELGGWDEGYVGYGSEDIDLLWRMRKGQGFEFGPVEGIRVFHQPHEPIADKETQGRHNMTRLQGKLYTEFDGLLEVRQERDGFEHRVRKGWV